MDAEPTQSLLAEQRARWGDATDPGLLIVPVLLLRHQARLGLSTLHVLLILNIIAEWDEPGELPVIRVSVLAKRIGVCSRTIQRGVADLERTGLLRRLPMGRFDPAGLQQRLRQLAKQDPVALQRRAAAL